jgi:multicomponent Na+:H+ antiporter subunit D
VGGTIWKLNGTDDLKRTGRLWALTPVLGVVFLFQALSLAGIPPLSGFWGKYMIIVEGVRQSAWILVAAALVAGILTLFSMLKIWNGAFWADEANRPVDRADGRWKGMTAVSAGMVGISLVIGFGAEWFLKLSFEAARQVMDRAAYIEFMLGTVGGGV